MPERPADQAMAELIRVRQIHAHRHLVQAAELLDLASDVIQLAREGSPEARQVLARWLELPREIRAALAGVQIIRAPLERPGE